jgi:hypothetical protein
MSMPNGTRDLKEANRLVRQALRDCDNLLERSERMLERSRQDNQPLR